MSSRRRNRARIENLTPGEADGLLYDDLADLDRARTITEPVPLDAITVVDNIQVRVGGLNRGTVREYAERLKSGGTFKPIVLYREDDEPTLVLSDGFHRLEAHHLALRELAHEIKQFDDPFTIERINGLLQSLAYIDAEIRPGGYLAAFSYAEDANLKHGLKLTNKDKFSIFERRILRGHDWMTTSNGIISREMGVSAMTIMRWRNQIAAEHPDNPNAQTSDARLGADGRVRGIDNIGKNQRPVTPQARLKRIHRAIDTIITELAALGDPDTAQEFQHWLDAYLSPDG